MAAGVRGVDYIGLMVEENATLGIQADSKSTLV